MPNKNNYSSSDFSDVPDNFNDELPENLIHENVIGTGEDVDFSLKRKHMVAIVNLPSKALSLTIGGLVGGEKSGRHRHSYETIIYILAGSGHSVINDRHVSWREGDAIYIPVWAWHQHFNDSSEFECQYLACENAPMLLSLGLAVRQEAEAE